MSDVKMILVWRKDLQVRKGKYGAQMAHCAQAWLLDRIKEYNPDPLYFSKEEKEWMNGNHKKVCLQVENEQELMEIYSQAKKAKLTVHLIVDAGLTEFGGIPTKTCIAIGPNRSNDIDKITSSLKLY